jgi:DNA-binding transcriptional regulator YhcF (GntR family)
MNRRERVLRMLFAAGERPITARELAWQTGVRVSGVRHVLRILERQGQAECLHSVTIDRCLRWRWKDRQGHEMATAVLKCPA